MVNEDWEKVKQIFSDALEIEASERESFVKKVCGDDIQLQEEVQSLLAAHENPGPLDKSPDNLKNTVFTRFESNQFKGKKIGPYKITGDLGHGGMGSVYLAERADGHFEQQVALKLLRTGFTSENQISRFLAERQILATLIHKNIARLLDGGVTDYSQPWFVMEYVEGSPIDQYCDENMLSVNERLDLFTDVCSAVHYAHQKLIVHRDLKPSNIFVKSDGTVKLLDFGIAKALKPDGLLSGHLPVTKTGLLPLTPAYASPEQIRGQPVTTSSDIYQLGIMLYELLTGISPYKISGRSPSEIEKIICEKAPIRPSTAVTHISSEGKASDQSAGQISTARKTDPNQLQKRLRGELDTIVLKAMHKEPERRYESADHLASDIGKFLSGKPVSAHPDSFMYRGHKFLRRHAIGAGAFAVIFLLLIGYAITITNHSQQTQAALEQAQRETEKAGQVTAFLMDMFEASDPSEALGDTVTAAVLLERGINQAEQLDNQPEIQAQMFDLTGRVYMNLGEYGKAETLLKKGLRLRQDILNPPHADIGESLHNLGVLYWNNGQYDEAEQYLRRALDMKHEIEFEDSETRATTMIALAIVLKELRKFDEAEPLYREAHEINLEINGEKHESVAFSLNNLGNFLESQGEYQNAKQYYLESYEIYRDLYGDEHPDVAGRLINLGRIHERLGDNIGAINYLNESLKIRRAIFDKNHPDIAESLYHLGTVLLDIEEFEESEDKLKQALKIQRSTLDPLHPDISQTLNSLGILMGRTDNYKASESYYRESLDLKQQRLGENHSEAGITMNNLGLTLIRQEKYSEARQYLDQSLSILLQHFEDDHPLITYPLLGIAHIHLDTEEPEKAEPYLRKSLDIQLSAMGESHWMVGLIKSRLGRCLTAMNEFEKAEPLLIEGYELLADQLGTSHERTYTAIENLISLYKEWPKPEKVSEYRELLTDRNSQ